MAFSQPSSLSKTLTAVVFALIIAIAYRYSVIDASDPYKCGALQVNGTWVDPSLSYQTRPFQNWQPPGCMFHEYNPQEIHKCLGCKRLVFVGDSTTRQIFWAVSKKLDKDNAERAMSKFDKHGNLHLEKNCTKVEFVWDPYLNSSRLHRELTSYRRYNDPSYTARDNTTVAAVLIVGGGLWHARHLGSDYLLRFKQSYDNISQIAGFDQCCGIEKVIRPPTLRWHPNLLLILPVQTPYYQKLSPERAETILPEKVLAMHKQLRQIATDRGLEVLWSFVDMIWHRPLAYEGGGLHVTDTITANQADVILNLRCNSDPSFDRFPFDKTCCNNEPTIRSVQGSLLHFAAAVVGWILGSAIIYRYTHWTYTTTPSFPTHHQLKTAIGFFAATLWYCFAADRTTIFDKVNKVQSQETFLWLSGIALAAGLISLRDSQGQRVRSREPQAKISRHVPDQPFLSRQQTEEWKGWMQTIVLLYHYTGMSKVFWVYKVVRILVASYLFMTGYGHTLYFLSTGDYSVRRVAAVLFRLNMLSCLLPYIMRTTYDFYYFPALTSFWFLIIYATMKLQKAHNNSLTFLLVKVLISAVVTSTLTKTAGMLEKAAEFLKMACNISWNVYEWRFRVSLDMYIVYVGMVVAMLYHQVTVDSELELRPRHVATVIRRRFQCIAIPVALGTFLLFWFVTRQYENKYEYNKWHPYVSCFPVLSFVILRNAHRNLRNLHCAVFAWLGRCSLETFILQYHIWLAGDTKGLLRLGLFSRKGTWWGNCIEFVLISAIFLWISWAVSQATNVLTTVLAGSTSQRKGLTEQLDGENDGIELPSSEKEFRGFFHRRNESGGTEETADNQGEAYRKKSTRGWVIKDVLLKLKLTMIVFVALVLNWIYE